MASRDKLVLESGEIQVRIEYRHSGTDEGLTFHVCGRKDKGKEIELLRFDCFKKHPHYHYDPSGKNEQHAIDKKKIPDPLAWVLELLKTELPQWIERAGYSDIARALDQNHLARAIVKIESGIESLRQPTAAP